ncbi:UNVERIFIED_CONTAM: hypothetical protein HDU68_007576 [Siphonaria sp. JEL0065]|nr:hypothetical protein HDU68_007576 [Siphonaria sp. JEL0065]
MKARVKEFLVGVSRSAQAAIASLPNASLQLITRRPTYDLAKTPTSLVTNTDAADIPALNIAFRGASAALIVTPHDLSSGFQNDAQNTINMINAAAQGVKHIVLVGTWTTNNPIGLSKLAQRFISPEKVLKENGVYWTILRGGFFTQNLMSQAASIKNRNVTTVSKAKYTPVDVYNIGYCAARILLDGPEKHHGKVYEMNGPEVLSMEEPAIWAEGVYDTIGLASPFTQHVGELIGHEKWMRFGEWAEKNKAKWA